ncbi:MAG TPA: DUF1566 domain-containing protein [Candidatus Acidoferrales bacterium]|nr:DUF1566 domain-containing protein [Candidatus Acidoferrales bacterium]
MKSKPVYALGLALLVVVALAAGHVEAQTTANGPYYAWPSWDQKLPSSTRFIVLSNWNSQAVLDRETGLVWERSPLHPSVFPLPSGDSGERTWEQALTRCVDLSVGNRKGWRLPTVQELASLLDPAQFDPTKSVSVLPVGHPFQNVQDHFYWSATSHPDPTLNAVRAVSFFSGTAGATFVKTSALFVWCVRGGHGVDAQ